MASSSSSATVQDVHEELQGFLDDLGQVESELDHVRGRIDALVQRQDRLLTQKQELKTRIDQLQTLCQRLETERGDFQKSDFPWSAELHRLKRSVFGIESLRAMQEQVMNTTLSGRDSLLVMPTGAGKSLCYQLPALISKGVTLVVSPLVSLMEDQVLALEQLGIPADLLNASTPPDKLKAINAAMLDPKAPLRLLYVTPEKIAKSKRFMAQLQKCYTKDRLARIAIDEVHCCSQWGHDFRPDYKMLGVLKRQFPEVPVLGLTATATANVLEDVKGLLNLHACIILRSSYNRANLLYQVHAKPSSEARFIELLVQLLNGRYKGQSGIIYCLSRKNTEQVALALQGCNIQAEPYHADLEASYRSAVHGRWKSGLTQVVIATIAFGMGIDKPDVRFVIHHSLSKSLENYYQESGRAGRDDKPAECTLFFQSSDVFRQSTMVMVEQTGLQKLYAMVAYCIDKHRCRRSIQAEHFDERLDANKQLCNDMCDNCRYKEQVHNMKLNDYYISLLQTLQAATKKTERITPLKLVDKWLAKKPSYRLEGSKRSPLSRVDCEFIMCYLLLEGYLKEDFHFTPYTTISYILPGPKASSSLTQPIVFKYRPSDQEGEVMKADSRFPESLASKAAPSGSKSKKTLDGGSSSSCTSVEKVSQGLTTKAGLKRTKGVFDVKVPVSGKGHIPTKKRKAEDSSEVIVIQ
ncbi:ATP-dependent DNA helicase Q1-like [Acanthaster planci]|uniref:ATP-dependent DNA helicase n=1 Tax=Acanthaster planci TaxID=133434 RepID=A0A8B7XKX1_ACAPL|nr:ATP-dependent DNA helicase Q1-like [Acanthaster planci]XP_022081455.1 ATP-dependent DNA helicase Q1-like [Acanthaster planci]